MLQDVSAGAELRRDGGQLDIVQPFFGAPNEVPGTTGQLSPDGNFVLTHDGDGRPSSYDVRDGGAEATWFDDRRGRRVAATFTVEGRIAWVVDSHDGSFGLYECQRRRDYINSFDPQASRAPARRPRRRAHARGDQPGLVAAGER